MKWRQLSVGVGVVAVVAAVVAVAALRLNSAADDLRQAESSVEAVVAAIADGRLAEARQSLANAETSIQKANSTLQSSISLSLLGPLPVVNQNLGSLRDSVELAATVIHGGQRILSTSQLLEGPDGTLQVSLSDGSIPMDAVLVARREVQALLDQLSDVRADSGSRLLLPAARELRQAVNAEAISRRRELDRVSRGLTVLNEIAGGDRPRRFLLAVANTAEMRGTGGMMLNYGVLEGSRGVIDLGSFGRVEELIVGAPVDPATVGLPEDYLRRWEGFDVTREWRNATMSGDFSLAAPALEAMFRRATGVPADGVIQVDPSGLAAILRVVGPVIVDEVGLITSENVEALVLNEAYRQFPGVEERTDVLGDVAEAAFRRLVDGEFPSVRDLAEAVAEAVDGRHIMVHSATSGVESAISSFGADGSLPDPETQDYAHLTVQNLSGNKLDYYMDTRLDITGQRPGGEIGSWHVEITLTNTARASETTPTYIFGPFDDTQTVGTHRAAVTLYLPTGTSLTSALGSDFRLAPALQTEAGRPLVGFIIDVPAGESRSVALDLQLAPRPSGTRYQLLLVPQARVRPTAASVRIDTGGGEAVGEVGLDRSWAITSGGPPRPLSGV